MIEFYVMPSFVTPEVELAPKLRGLKEAGCIP